MVFRSALRLLFFVCALASASSVFATRSVSLSWDPSPDANVIGYRLALGTASGTYTQTIDVQNATSATAPSLAEGVTYYFAVTAYNSTLGESAPSNEVAVTVASGGPSPTPTPAPSPQPTPTPAASPQPTPTPTPVPPATPTPTPQPPVSTPTPTPVPASFVNVSTRANVQTGDDVLIGGLIISGTQPKRVLVRALGPSLASAGVTGALADPMLTLHDSTGAMIASNNNWRSDEATVNATGLAPGSDSESAIATTLSPGAYTAIVSGVAGTPGVALFELYDLDNGNSKIANISTRSRVSSGASVMIGGFIVSGEQSAQVVVRALGPSLTAAGVSDALADPVLELYNSSGSQIFANDNWQAEQQDQIAATALAPNDPRESAIMATLAPGAYTAIVRGANGATGVALVEVYYAGP